MSNVRKYELITTDTVTTESGQTLYRIKALIGIPMHQVKIGDLGGYIYGDAALSHEGQCWVADEARVCDNAYVRDNAYMRDSSTMYDNSRMSGDAYMCGNSSMYDNSRMYGSTHSLILHKATALLSGTAQLRASTQLYWRIDSSPMVIISSDGYTFAYNAKEDKVSVGDHYFTYDEAVQRWTRTKDGTPLGEECLSIIKMLRTHYRPDLK